MNGISPTKDGLLVRIYRNKKAISRHVAWSAHPDKESAQRAAEAKLAELNQLYPEPPKRKVPRASVSYTHSRGDGGTGSRMFTWQVTYWNLDGSKHTKDFWVHKYDNPQHAERDARAFAVACDIATDVSDPGEMQVIHVPGGV